MKVERFTEFEKISIGTKFRLHHKNGLVAVKKSTRTAKFIDEDKIYYVENWQPVYIEGV